MAKKKIYTIERDKDNPQFKRYHTMWADLPTGGGDSEIFDEYIDATDQQRNTALANVSNQTANSTTGKMGYKVLDPTKTFAEQVTAENTIYEIRDVFDLGGTQETPASVTLPAGSTLKFNGGLIKNCTLNGDDTVIDTSEESFDNVAFTGVYSLDSISPDIFVGSDTVKLQKACDLSYRSNYCPVLIIRNYTITNTINNVHNVQMSNDGGITIETDVDGLSVVGDRAKIVGGYIQVNKTTNNYTHSCIVLNGPILNVLISDIRIEGFQYNNPSLGNGIKINTATGRHFGHVFKNLYIAFFNKGISIDITSNWANNLEIELKTSYNNYSIYYDGSYESSGNNITIYGQPPLKSVAGVDSCVVYDHNGNNVNNYDIQMFDFSNGSYIDTIMDIRNGFVKFLHPAFLKYCKQIGWWESIQDNIRFDGSDSCINGCDGERFDWITHELIGSATYGIYSLDILSWGKQPYYGNPLVKVPDENSGIKYTITFPKAINAKNIYLQTMPNQGCKKVVLTLTGTVSGNTVSETIEIYGNRLEYGRVFDAHNLFTYRVYDKCTKVELSILGTNDGAYSANTYTSLAYFGISDINGIKFGDCKVNLNLDDVPIDLPSSVVRNSQYFATINTNDVTVYMDNKDITNYVLDRIRNTIFIQNVTNDVYISQTHYLSFEALEDNTTIKMITVNNPDSVSLEYSEDKLLWESFIVESGNTVGTILTLDAGEKVYLRGNNSRFGKWANSMDNYHKFVITGSVRCDGDLTSLLNGTGGDIELTKDSTFYHLFEDCTALVNTPNLPSSIITSSCYQYLFKGCSNITETCDSLPAKTAQFLCYYCMYSGCVKLENAPKIMLESSADRGCSYMFANCSKINSVEIHLKAISSNVVQNWLNGVKNDQADPGTLTCYEDVSANINKPSNWTFSFLEE